MSDRLATRLTRRYGLALPVVLAPMALAAGGALAAACARGGALGLVGGGYGDLDWTRREYTLATQQAGAGALLAERLGPKIVGCSTRSAFIVGLEISGIGREKQCAAPSFRFALHP